MGVERGPRRKSRRAGSVQPAPPPQPRSSVSFFPVTALLPAAGIALGVGLAYANSLAGPFVFDDLLAVADNATIRQWSNFSRVFRPPLETPVAGRPLVNLTFAVNYAVGGVEVTGYHIVNLLLHVLCAVLVFGIVRRTLQGTALQGTMSGRRAGGMAFAVAIIWALHPLNTDAVTYVTQRTEVLMAACYLLTLYCSIRAWQSRRAVALVRAGGGGMCGRDGLQGVDGDRAVDGPGLRRDLRRRHLARHGAAARLVLRGAGGVVGGAAAGGLRRAGTLRRFHRRRHPLDLPAQSGGVDSTLPGAGVVAAIAGPDYGAPQDFSVADVLAPLLLMTALVALTGVLLVRAPKLGFLGLWLFVTLAPTSSLVPIATEVAAERRMYLPLVAVVALGVVAVSWLMRERRVAWSAAALACCSALLGLGTWSRNRDYAEALVLARTSVERYPSAIGRHALGVELLKVGRTEDGMTVLREATAGTPRARFALGLELFNQGKWQEAGQELSAFVRAEPDLLEAVTAREALGRALASMKQWPAAVEQFKMVLQMNPTRTQRDEAQEMLAESLFHAEQYEASIAAYTAYLTGRPGNVTALTNMGIAFAAEERLTEAIAAFRRAVDLNPDNGDSHRNLATALSDAGDRAGAIPHAEKAVALRPGDPAAHFLLGSLLAGAGRDRRGAAAHGAGGPPERGREPQPVTIGRTGPGGAFMIGPSDASGVFLLNQYHLKHVKRRGRRARRAFFLAISLRARRTLR